MQITDDANYRGITNCRRGLIPKKVVGRGICKTDPSNSDSYCEFQTASIDKEENELKTIKKFAERSIDYYKCKVKQLAKIPNDITSKDLESHMTDLENVPIGVDLYEKKLANFDFATEKSYIITGRNIAENINFIYALTTLLPKLSNTKVRVLDLMQIFNRPILDIQKFDQNPNDVIEALENDVLTRTDAQDDGVNIIIGAGRFKQVLNEKGIKSINNLFEHILDSKKSRYVLIDNYDDIRNLKVESWFKNINTSKGIWLGTGLSAQSIFENTTVQTEDTKLNYPGLGFIIENDEYRVIKTVMDKDE
jgi:hypothetical protein